MKISVTIITLNEEAGIRKCLESVKWADEIIIFDSGSADQTVKIAKEYTDRVFVENNWEGYGKQKNRCAARAKNQWILNVDADERVSEELKNEILKTLSQGPRFFAYSVVRKNFIGERWIRYAGWYPDRIIRLYHKNEAAFAEPLVHEGIQTEGKTGVLNGCLLHRSFHSLQDYFQRQDRYATLSAREMARSGGKASLPNLFLRPPFAFLKTFLLKKGILEGYYGLALAHGHALYTYKKYARLRELNKNS